MSHVTKLKCKILESDVEILSETCKRLGFILQDVKHFEWHGGRQSCDMAIKVPGVNYSVGLVKNKQGSFDLKCDTWGGLGGKIGRNGEKLIQEFTADKLTHNARMRGWAVERQKEKEVIKLTLSKR